MKWEHRRSREVKSVGITGKKKLLLTLLSLLILVLILIHALIGYEIKIIAIPLIVLAVSGLVLLFKNNPEDDPQAKNESQSEVN